jgi:serine/arginine repetitive matrix protein 2
MFWKTDSNQDVTLDLVRVGLVGAANTPATVEADHRASGHISLIDEDTRRRGDPLSQLRALSHSSSLQPWSADFTRSSYMTSDTGASRISGLSDFPDPPISGMTPAHMSVLASYFSSAPSEEEHTESPPDRPTEPAPSEPPSTKFSLRRMTFGGDEDIETLADPGPSEA